MTKEKQYIERMYNNAICDPDVDAMDRAEVTQNIRDQAESLCLDPDTCVELLNDRFPQVMTGDFKRASDMIDTDSPI